MEEQSIEKIILNNLKERRDIDKNEYKFIKSLYKCYINSVISKEKIYNNIIN